MPFTAIRMFGFAEKKAKTTVNIVVVAAFSVSFKGRRSYFWVSTCDERNLIGSSINKYIRDTQRKVSVYICSVEDSLR